MNKFNYIVLVSALGLTACGGESTEAPAVEAPAVEAPAVEAPAVEAPAVEAPAVEAPEVEAPEVEVPVVDLALSVPKGLRISSTFDTVTVDWAVDPKATGYNVYYNEGDDVTAANGMVYFTTVSEFTHSNVSGDLHSYKVQAVVGDSASELSMLMTATLMADEDRISDSSFDQ